MEEKQKVGRDLAVKFLHYALEHCLLANHHFPLEVRVILAEPSTLVNYHQHLSLLLL